MRNFGLYAKNVCSALVYKRGLPDKSVLFFCLIKQRSYKAAAPQDALWGVSAARYAWEVVCRERQRLGAGMRRVTKISVGKWSEYPLRYTPEAKVRRG